jgi:hypothetical protein
VENPNDLERARVKLAKLLNEAKGGAFDKEVRKKGSGRLNISALCRKYSLPRVLTHKKLFGLLEDLKAEYKSKSGRPEEEEKQESSASLEKREHEKVLALCRYFLAESNEMRHRLRNSEDEAARLRREVGSKPRAITPAHR